MTAALLLHRADGAVVSTPFRRAALGGDDPFAAVREVAWAGPDRISAGRVTFSGRLDTPSYPHIETLVVVEGELTLATDGAAPLVLAANAGAVIAPGTRLRIEAKAGARFVYCAAAGGDSAAPGVTPLRADADLKPSSPPPAEALLGPTPACRSDNVFTDEATRYRAGTWDSTPYRRIVRAHRLNEFMHLLAGGVRFASPDGSVMSARAGDALFVPEGAPIGWESTEHVAKFYVVQSAKA
ncbi:cupin domain-containing protein [Roseateles sp.]|uniref:cupin domain-containing protein n=1 Tax=Roseateles sp. TaxID=1971397 RepID=UPI002DFE3583|nr:cupin domain-containing protein [Roseateles sp.]